MCDFSTDPKVGDIVLASIDGEQTVKIFQRIRGDVWLVLENKDFQPIRITENMDCKIQGVAVHDQVLACHSIGDGYRATP